MEVPKKRTACGTRYRHLKRGKATATGSKRGKVRVNLDEYLKSSTWKIIRSVIIEDTPVCEICNTNPSIQVYHTHFTAAALKGQAAGRDHLVAVCSACNSQIEFKPNGTKRPHIAASRSARRLLEKATRLVGCIPFGPYVKTKLPNGQKRKHEAQ